MLEKYTNIELCYPSYFAPLNIQDFAIEPVAFFLLMPMKLLKKEFKMYPFQVNSYEELEMFWRHWSDVTQLSFMELPIAYRYMKIAIYREKEELFKDYMEACKKGEKIDWNFELKAKFIDFFEQIVVQNKKKEKIQKFLLKKWFYNKCWGG